MIVLETQPAVLYINPGAVQGPLEHFTPPYQLELLPDLTRIMHQQVELQHATVLCLQLGLVDEVEVEVAAAVHDLHVVAVEDQRGLHAADRDVVQLDAARGVAPDRLHLRFVGLDVCV